MAESKPSMVISTDATEVLKLLVWVRQELGEEIANLGDTNERLEKMKYEVDRVLRKYNVI